MRKRYSLSFNLEDERHKKAHELLKERPLKQQSEFIVSCILAAQEKTELKDAIYDGVCRALDSRGTMLAPKEPISEDGVIPANMMDFLSSL
mgnify:CR=1 FL=1